MEEDFTEESSDGTLVRGDDHSYDAHKFPFREAIVTLWTLWTLRERERERERGFILKTVMQLIIIHW